MKTEIVNNSFVLLAEAHNPTVISDYFLLESKIIANIDQVNRETSIITPAFAQINLKDSTSITLDPNRLAITSPIGQGPFEQGQNYCKSLSYIKGKAIGINFVVNVSEIDAKKWFDVHNKLIDASCIELKYKFSNCTLSVGLTSDTTIQLGYNFHYELESVGSLGEIQYDFVSEWEKDKDILYTVLNKLFPD